MTFIASTRPVLEELEPRILYSADLAAVAMAGAGAAGAHELRLQTPAAADATAAAREVAFVDMSLPDAKVLVTGLLAERDGGRNLEVVRIEPGDDGVAVIGQTLAQQQGVTAIHLLTHGSDGEVQLGAVRLDATTLLARSGELAQWSAALGVDADLLIYGCDVAAGPAGQALVTGLAALTGADVAASTDLTGAAAKGGNWALEFSTGRIDTAGALDTGLQQAYPDVLAIATTGVSSGATSNAQPSLTFSHTVAAGANGLLMVQVMTGNTEPVTSVTYGGVALTFVDGADTTGTDARAEFWMLKAPVAGTASVVVTVGNSTKIVAGATSFVGVDQTAPIGPVVSNKAADGLPTLSVPAALGDVVIDVTGALRVNSYTNGPGQTEAWTNANGNGNGDVWAVSSTEPGAATVAMTHSFTSVGGASDEWVALGVAIKPANTAAPVITSDGGGATATRSVSENTTAVTNVAATDADGTVPTYAIAGGADAARFTIGATTGALAFASAPDFEAPVDTNADNVYVVIVSATDGTNSDTQTLSVTVTNVNEAPVITSGGGGAGAAVSIAENTTAVTTVTAVDPEGTARTYSIAGGLDAARFAIDASTGALRFLVAPDFETPLDNGANNVYDVTVRASDGALADTQAIAVTVTDVGGPFAVTTTTDTLDGNVSSIEMLVANPGIDGKISLREAISATNNTPGADTILLPAGTYQLTIPGAGENFNATGDLDVRDSLTIVGAGAASTVVSGGSATAVLQFVSGSATVSGVTVKDGTTLSTGAGIEVDAGASLALSQAVVRNNVTSFDSGGGIWNNGALTLTDVEVRDNSAYNYGGGIYHTGTALTLSRVTLAGNSAWQGAGLYASGAAPLLTDVTVSGNSASQKGGGLYLASDATLLNGTIANNSAWPSGGGIYTDSATYNVTLRNVLLSNNAGGTLNKDDGSSGVTSLGNNLSDRNNAELNQASDLKSTAAGIAALADNGGYGRTHAVLPGSAAIDAGNTAAAPATDQRGVARVGAADIGAFESSYAPNRVPVNAVPGAQTLFEDVATAIAGVSVTDPDSGGGVASYELSRVALSVSNGTVQVTLTGSAAVVTGANASAALTLTGSQADINATLASLHYRGNANYVGGDTLVVISQDGLGLTDADSVAITVVGVNDPPRGTDATLSVDRNGSRTLARADFGFGDAAGEGNGFASVLVQPPSAGSLRLDGTPMTAATEVAVAQLDAGQLVWAPVPGTSGTGYATLRFQVRDDGGVANGGVDLDPVQRTLSFDVIDHAPVIGSDGGGATAALARPENATAVTTVTASDLDGDAPTYSIVGGPDAARFTIDAATGALRFAVAPNYEVPLDIGANNVYDVTVQASDGTLADTQSIAVTVTDVIGAPGAASGSLWFTTAGAQTTPAGGATWSAGQVLEYGNAGDRFDIDGGLTTGSVDLLPGFTAPAPIRGLHYVQSTITLGTTGARFTLNPGDLLLVLDPGAAPATVTLNAGDGNPANDVSAERQDIVVYRPATAGNYASGEYFMLLDNGVHDGATLYNVHALSLVEKDTLVGGTLLPAGTFVAAHSNPALHSSVYTFDVTGTGAGAATQTSNAALLLDGTTLGNSGDQIQGLHLITRPTAFNDTALSAGTLLVAINGSNTYAGVAEDSFDVVALNVTRTERNGGTQATGQRLFDGSDLGLTDTAVTKNINGLTVVTGLVGNNAPALAVPLADQFTNPGVALSYALPAGSFVDADPGDTLNYAATRSDGSALPAWLAFDPSLRAFTGTPTAGDLGTLSVRVTVTDRAGAVAFDDFKIAVTAPNAAPVNSLPGAQSVVQDSSLSFTTAGGNAIAISDAEAGGLPVRVDLSATHGVLDLASTIGPEFQVNTTTASDQQAPRIAVASDGHYVVVWQSNNQDGSKNGVYARVFNADGSARTGEIAVNTTTNDQQSDPAIAIDGSGRFVIAWQSYDTAKLTYDIYARSFNADGTALSAQKRITTDADDQTLAAVSMDAAGNVVIVYTSRGQDSGTTLGVYARTANTALSTINVETRVNTTTALDQAAARVAAGNGGYVVVWQSAGQDGSGTGVYGQRFTTAGAKIGGEFLVNGTTALDQAAPAVAMAADGRFVVTWQSAGQDGSGVGVYARRYDAAGTAQGGEFRVNTTTAGDQTTPRVAIAPDGRFVVAWTSVGQDNADGKEGVYAQGFAVDGTRVGPEFRLNTTAADVQSMASIGLRSDGGLLAVWQSKNQDGNGFGVFGQRFLAPGAITFLAGDGAGDTSMSLTGAQADIDVALQTLRYTPDAGYWGPASLTLVTNDLGAGNGPPLSTTSALPIQVLKIDVGPVNAVPAAQATAEDTPIVFSAANGNALKVADVDADPLPVQVALSVVQGTLRLSTAAGLTVVGGADGSASITVQGRLADLNAALEGLTYTPASNYNGADTLTLATNDLGHSDVGGPYTATSTVGLTISAVNDAPAILLPAVAVTTEGNTLVLSTANGNLLSIADPDSGSASIEVTLASTYGELKLARTNNLAFTVGTGKGGEQRMTFRGTLANVDLALDGLQFTPLSGYAGPAWLEVATSDLGNSGVGGALAGRAVLEITVQPDANNARPVLTLPPNQSTTEETPLLLSSVTGNAISVLDDAGGLPLQVTLGVDFGTLSLGTSTGGEFQVNTAVASDQQAPAIAMMPTGAHVVVWQSNNQDGSNQGIYLQRYSEEGFALGPEQRVNTTTAGAQAEPAVAMADGGGFVVVWTSDGVDGGGGGGSGIVGQRYGADGQPLGGEFRVNTMLAGDQSAAAVACDAAGNFVVVWQSKDQDGDGWGLYGRRFNADGSAQGGEFRINTVTAKDQSAPAVTMAPSGAFVVAWQGVRPGGTDLGIYAQRFDAAGAAAGSEFRVATVTYKDQTSPAIASDDAGNVVIAWQSQDIDYNDGKFGIYAQRYAADGSALGVQFLVNTTTPNSQTTPSVAMDGSGAFAVAWQSTNQAGSDSKADIYAQQYDAGGARIGGEFQVNATIADAQAAPALARSNDGRLTVVWTSDKQDGAGLGVFGQRFIDARSLGFSVGDGTNDATMTFTGTLDQINDVLDGLVFTPAPDFDGKATLDITVNDLGHSGSGGVKLTTGSVQITVLPVNDAPTITLPTVPSFVEDAPIVFSAAAGRAITVADVDAGTKKLLVTLAAPVGTLTLGTLGGLQFSAGDGTADAAMSFTGTLAQINAALNGMTLALPAHYTGAAAVDLTVNDQGNTGTGGALGTSAGLPITVVPGSVNDAPQVKAPGPQRTAVDTPLVLAAGTTGAVTVVDDAGSSPVRVSVTVTNGTVTLSGSAAAEATINRTITAGNQEAPRVAVLANGDHIVVWTSDTSLDKTEIFGQRFDASGARVGPEFTVNTTHVDNQWAPALAANASGAFAVAWVSDNQDGSGRGVYLQRFDAQGHALGSETRVNTTIAGDQTAPSIAIDASGAVVVAWQTADADGLGVFAQRVDANGQPSGGEFQLSGSGASDQRAPALAMDAAGNFVAVWQGEDADKEGVIARRFDALGNPLGAEFVVNTATLGSQITPVVAMNDSGAWVVGWQTGSGGSAGEIRAQRFDATGTAVGSSFQVNTTTAEAQTAPSVAINGTGSFAFAWQSKDANGQGIFGQSFDASGAPVGREQQVNTTTAGDQVASSIGIAADGSYRVVWTGDNQDGSGTGIAGQSMLRGDELVFLAGDGVDDASFSFDATLANLNAALDGLRFTPSPGFVGVAQIQVSVDDRGASGSGGALVGSTTVSIVVGNAPLIDLDADNSAGVAGADFRVNFRTGLGPVPVADSDALIADPNSANLQSLTIRIQNPLDGASEVLAASTNGTTIVASYNSASATLTLSGNAAQASYQKVLRTVTYNNTAGTPTPVTRSVTFVAFDGSGNSNVATASVLFNGGVDSPPVAGDDVFAALEDQALLVVPGGVLVNDADPDLDALSAVLVSNPTFGTLSAFGADGSFTYVPAPGFNGVDSFTYQATAGGLNSAPATVKIVVNGVNDAPQGADALHAVDEDQAYVFVRSDFGFSDPNDTPSDGLLGVQITVLPGAGTLAVGGIAVSAGDTVSASDLDSGLLTFMPAPNANGAAYAQIGFQVRDDGGRANGGIDTDPVVRTLTIDVHPVNDPPAVGVPIADQAATEDAPFSFVLPGGSLVDVDAGDTLSIAARLDDGSPLPAWLAFDPTTQTFSGTPANADVGAFTVRVTATDAAGATAFDDFVLTVVNQNDPPVLTTTLPDRFATQDQVFSAALTPGAFTDVDAGDTLVYGAGLASGAAWPAWLNFDAATQTFSGTPGNADVGALTVRVTATDAAGASVHGDFVLTVANVNDPPVVATPIADQAAVQDAPFSFTVGASTFADIDAGDVLAYGATLADGSALPSWLGFDAGTRTFSGTPRNADVGTLGVRVGATDAAGASVAADFTLTVANVNDAPTVAAPIAGQLASEDLPFSFTFAAGTFADIDVGDTLSYAASLSNGNPLPAWLTFDDVTRSFSGTPAQADVGTLGVRVTAFDTGGASVGCDFALTVQEVNDPPAIGLPSPQVVAANGSIVLATFRGNAIVLSDPDAGGSLLDLTLAVSRGTLTLGSTTGLSFSVGDGSADALMRFQGSLASLNAALEGARFVAAPGFIGPVDLTLTLDDLGHSGLGGAQSTSATLLVEVADDVLTNSVTAGNQTDPSAAMDATGAYVVTWTSSGEDGSGAGIYGQRYDGFGVAQGAAFRVNSTTAGDQVASEVAMAPGGEFVVVWTSSDGSSTGIFGQRFGADGTPVGAQFAVNAFTANAQVAPTVAMAADGSFVVAFASDSGTSRYDVFARRFDSAGSPLGAEVRVNTGLVDNQFQPTIAMNAGGGYVVAWTTTSTADGSGRGVFAQRFASDGTPLGSEFQVNTTSAGNQDRPDIGVFSDGGFIVTWTSGSGQDGDKSGVFAQRYAADGSAQGAEFQVNTRTLDTQYRPSVAVDASDAFAIVWTSKGQDGSGWGVYVQRFDATGARDGLEYRLNATTSGDQWRPVIAAGPAGQIVGVWEGAGPGDTYGIFQRLPISPNDPPIITTPGAQTVAEDTTLVLSTVGGNRLGIADPDAFGWPVQVTLSATAGTLSLNSLAGLSFSVGDGVADTSMSFTGTLAAIGAAVDGLRFDPQADFAGTATIAVLVDDQGHSGAGGAKTASASVSVGVTGVNDPPVVSAPLPDQTSAQGAVFAFSVAAGTFADVDAGDTLSLGASGLPGWLSFDASTQTFSGTPANGDVGRTTITVTATDGAGAMASTSFDLTVANVNDAPTAAPVASQNATEDQPFTLTLPPGTFADVDAGDTLSLGASGLPGWLSFDATTRTFSGTPANGDVGRTTITVTATDGAGATASTSFDLTVANVNDTPTAAPLANQGATEDQPFTLTLPPGTFADVDAGDTLSLGASGLPGWLSFDATTRTFSGTPANGDVGRTTITVTATDGSGATASTSFDLTVANVNDTPTAAPVANQGATEGQPFTVTLPPGTFADVDAGDTLSLGASGLPGWLSFDASTRTFSGTPANGDVGRTTITVTATDGAGATASTSFDLTVANVNDTPTAAPLANQSATEDQPFTLTLPPGTFADVDAGDTLSLGASGLPGWLSFDASTQTFSGTPANGDVGRTTITVTATDGAGATASTSFDLTVANVNDTPTAAPLASQNATEDQPFTLTLPPGTFADVDAGDTLSLGASGLPGWLSFDATTQTFSGTPANGDVGRTTITVTATDGAGATASTSFDLTVANVNDTPTAAPLANQSATEDQPFTLTLPPGTFADVDAGDTLSLGASGLPGWLSFDATTRTFSGTPANGDVGRTTITVTATDGSGATASTSFDLTVANVNDTPTAAPVANQGATEGQPFTVTLPPGTFADVDAGDTLSLGASGLPGWLSFDASTQTFSGTPANGDVGRTTITVTATDGAGATASTSFDLVVANVNDTPTAAPVANQGATEDQPFTLTLPPGTFADVDAGDTLSLGASGLPGWLSFDASTQTFSGTPANGDVGRTTITVTATDGSGATASTSFDLTVANVDDAPRFTSYGGTASATLDAPENASAAAWVQAVDDDVGTTLTYAIAGGADAGALRIDSATGRLEFVVPPNYELPVDANRDGRYEVDVSVTDGQLTATQSLSIAIVDVNEPPVVSAHTFVISDGIATISLTASDIDTAAAALIYQVDAVSGGHFERVSGPGTPTLSFSQAEVDAASLIFVRDASGVEPIYQLTLSDGLSHLAVAGPEVRYAVATAAPALPAVVQSDSPAATSQPVATSAGADRGGVADLAPRVDSAPAAVVTAPEVAPAYETLTPSPGAAVTAGQPATASAARAGAERVTGGFGDSVRIELSPGESAPVTRTTLLDFDAQTSQATRSFAEQLDRVREEVAEPDHDSIVLVGGASAVATGLSAGYVLWLVRGGVLLASLMSSVPAWAAVDPLPILAQMRRGDEDDGSDEDGESVDPIEELFGRARRLLARPAPAAPTPPDPARAETLTAAGPAGSPETPA